MSVFRYPFLLVEDLQLRYNHRTGQTHKLAKT